jgi:membrane-associated phospholipid phosphatase
MKVLLFVFLLAPLFGQTDPAATDPQQPVVEAQQPPVPDAQQRPPTEQTAPPQEPQPEGAQPQGVQPQAAQPQQPIANRSAIQVKRGGEALKNKDFWEASGIFHPFVRMPRYILQDQKAIWTSPFHTKKQDIKWWVIFGTATGTLIALDKHIQKVAPDTSTLRTIGADTSNLGAAYTLIPIGAMFYFAGSAKGSQHFRETGMLMFESLVDTTIVELIIKSVTNRERPLEGNGEGRFFHGNSVWNASFPSGHAINTFGMASIFAHEYPHKLWVKLLAYGYAGAIVGARLAADKHFPSDVVAGGAMGWFIGDYVYAKRHNPDVDKKPVARKILEHIRIGPAPYPVGPGF